MERGRTVLLGAVGAVGLLLAAMAWLAGRGLGVPRQPAEARENERGLDPLAHLAASAELAPAAGRQDPVQREATTPLPADEPARATISGRLVIDGFAPSRGRVHVRAVRSEWERQVGIDPYGRFYLEGVPPAELLLAFEAEGLFERQLVLPNLFPVHPAPGEIHVVDLDWCTRQLNLQVADGDALAGPVEIELSGPNYRTRFLTNERGKARLSLVGSGDFRFRAELVPGVHVESSEALGDEGELETIVLASVLARRN